MSGATLKDVYPEKACEAKGHDWRYWGSGEKRCARCNIFAPDDISVDISVEEPIQTTSFPKPDQIETADAPDMEFGEPVEMVVGESVGFGTITKEEAVRIFQHAVLGDRPLDLPYVSNLLHASAELFAERNAVYKDNFRMVGRVMKALFPEPPKLETEADYNRWHLFELAIVKLSRYVIHFDKGGHADSLDDMIVYLAMVAALDAENGHRS